MSYKWVSAALCLAFTTSCHGGKKFDPPSGVLVAGFRETATHRGTPQPIRLAGHNGMPQGVELWLHVEPNGDVIDVKPIDPATIEAAVRSAALRLHYAPFKRNGQPAEAWVQDTFYVASAAKQPLLSVPFPKIADPKTILIQLSRTGCFGYCPAYTVSIRADGEVTFKGDWYVNIPGAHTARIAASEVSALLDRFRAANFLAMDNVYRAGVTDNPTYRLTLKLGNRTKTVEDYVGDWVGMPAVVSELEDAVDQVSDSARWVSSSAGTREAMQQAGIATNSKEAAQILRTAVLDGDLATVKSLLLAGTPTTPTDTKGMFRGYASASLPELAVESRNDKERREMLKTVLSSPTVGTDHDGKQRALASAVEGGHIDLAHDLIQERADPNARFDGEVADLDQNETYLSLAAGSGVWDMLDDALSRPHDIHAVDSNGRTALSYIAWTSPQHEDIFPLVDRLLAAGADHSDLDRILLDTCQPNWIPGLVARGGNINSRDSKGDTPLFQSCSLDGVKAMLDAGADPSIRNREGKTAIEATYPPGDGKEDERASLIRQFTKEHPQLKPR